MQLLFFDRSSNLRALILGPHDDLFWKRPPLGTNKRPGIIIEKWYGGKDAESRTVCADFLDANALQQAVVKYRTCIQTGRSMIDLTPFQNRAKHDPQGHFE